MKNVAGPVHIICMSGTDYHTYFQKLYFGNSYADAINKLISDKSVDEVLKYEGTDILHDLTFSHRAMIQSRYNDDFVVLTRLSSMEELKDFLSYITDDPETWIVKSKDLRTLAEEINQALKLQPVLTAAAKEEMREQFRNSSEWVLGPATANDVTDAELIEEAVHHLEADNHFDEKIIEFLRKDCEAESVSADAIVLNVVQPDAYRIFLINFERVCEMINESLHQLHPEIFSEYRRIVLKSHEEDHSSDVPGKIRIGLDFSKAHKMALLLRKAKDKKGWYVRE